MPKQIGWSNESNLLYQISQQISRLINVTGTHGGGGGITTLNTLTATTQTFATSTTGTDFSISSSASTHTFNLPSASASARGLLSSADFTTFNSKIGGSGTANYLAKFTASGTIGNSLIYDNGSNVLIGTTTDSSGKLQIEGSFVVNSYDTLLAPVKAGIKLAYNSATRTSYILTGQVGNFGGTVRIEAKTAIFHDNDSDTQIGRFENGNLIIGTLSNYASSKLTIESTTKGILIPRMTTAEINNIVILYGTVATGLQVYNTTLQQPCFYDGTAWRKVTHSTM